MGGAFENLLGQNIIPNGSFEQWSDNGAPEGWTVQGNGGECSPDSEYFAEGANSARLILSKTPGGIQLTSPPSPATPGQYLMRFTFRIVGLSKSHSYEGGQADVQIFWLGEGAKTLSKDYVSWSYFPLEWSYRDRFYTAPPGTTAVRVAVGIGGQPPVQTPSTVWFDDVAVCPYSPPKGLGENVTKEWSVTAGKELLKVPDAPSWFYLSGTEGHESTQAERVRDGEAWLGYAMHAKPGVPKGIVYHSAYTVEEPPGLYRVFFRIKCPASPPPKPELPIASIDVDSNDSGVRGSRSLAYQDFAVPGKYQDVWFDVVKRSSGWLSFRVWKPEEPSEFWLDHVRAVQLRRFSDPDLLSWYPGVAGSMGSKPTIERGDHPRLLLVKGLTGEAYHVEDATRLWPGSEVTIVTYAVGQNGPTVSGYPLLWKDLRKYDVVVFANSGFDALGPEQRYQLREYVSQCGGGLLILGGKAAYGNGGVRNSFLEPALPVKTSESRFDIVPVSGPFTKTSAIAIGNPKWQADLVCPFAHQVIPSANATVSLKAGNTPVMVISVFGKGRIACFTGSPYGDAGTGKTHFVDWKDWPLVVRNVLQWLAGQKQK